MYIYYTKEGKFENKVRGTIPYSKLHRLNGPALIVHSSSRKNRKEWLVNGKRHRLNGPASEWYEAREWWVNDKRHRLDGPAIVCKDGDKEWWVNGNLHRIDGPAVELKGGRKEWYVNGEKLNKKEVETWIKNNNINLKTKEHQVLFMLRFG